MAEGGRRGPGPALRGGLPCAAAVRGLPLRWKAAPRGTGRLWGLRGLGWGRGAEELRRNPAASLSFVILPQNCIAIRFWGEVFYCSRFSFNLRGL